MDTWNNGDSGKVVKKIIDNNFSTLYTSISQIKNNSEKCVIYFLASDWSDDGKLFIEYSKYNKLNPFVDLYIKNGNSYSFVFGGCEVTNDGIELQSDMAYDGKVVIG